VRVAVFLLLFTSGCAVTNTVTPKWEWIGITSTGTHNAHVEQAEEFMQDTVKNQSRIVEITHDLNQEFIYVAKKEDDIGALERSYTTSGKIQHAKAVSQELSEREFTKAPEPMMDLGQIINILIGLATGGTTMGAVAYSMRNKLKDVAREAIHNGQSTEVNNTEHLMKHV